MKSLVAGVCAILLAGTTLAAQDQSFDQPQLPGPITAGGQPAPGTVEPKKDAAPEHAHTGWASLLKDSSRDFALFPRRPSTWTFLALAGGAALAAHPADDYVESHIVGNSGADRAFSVGEWAGSAYVHVSAGVGLWVIGRYIVAPAAGEPRTNRYSEIGFDLIRAQILSQVVVHGIKYSVERDRPTGECCAFPSGHSATAFAVASVLERHFGYRGSWPALAAATYVGASRLVDNRHFLSDVMMGAGVGMASGWTVVGTRGRSSRFTMQPIPTRGGMMLAVTRVPGQP
jgi:membrane-associated phospholipid phosphatase